jgi:hypothetical protein
LALTQPYMCRAFVSAGTAPNMLRFRWARYSETKPRPSTNTKRGVTRKTTALGSWRRRLRRRPRRLPATSLFRPGRWDMPCTSRLNGLVHLETEMSLAAGPWRQRPFAVYHLTAPRFRIALPRAMSGACRRVDLTTAIFRVWRFHRPAFVAMLPRTVCRPRGLHGPTRDRGLTWCPFGCGRP